MNSLNTKNTTTYITLEIQVSSRDRLRNVAKLNRLRGYQPVLITGSLTAIHISTKDKKNTCTDSLPLNTSTCYDKDETQHKHGQ